MPRWQIETPYTDSQERKEALEELEKLGELGELKKSRKEVLKPYIFRFKDAEWASIIIANSVKQAKQLGYDYWYGEQEFDYTDIMINKVKSKVDISGLPAGVIDKLHLGTDELLKRNIMYYEDDEGNELETGDDDQLVYRR